MSDLMRRYGSLAIVVVMLGAPAAPAQQTNRSVLGRPANVSLRGGSIRGELLAVAPDSVWLLTQSGLTGVPVSGIRRLRIQRHSMTPGKIASWGLIGGVLTGLGMTAACSSLEDADNSTDCVGWFPVMLISWAPFTALAAGTMGSSWRFTPGSLDRARPFARFPQGLPPDLDPAALGGGLPVP